MQSCLQRQQTTDKTAFSYFLQILVFVYQNPQEYQTRHFEE